MQKLVVGLVSASYCKQHQNTMGSKTYKQRQHACSSEDGKVCNNVSKIYQDACSSGGRERVVKIFKKGGFNTVGCHAGGRNAPQISKGFKNEAVRGRVTGETSVLLSFFMINTDSMWARSHTCTHLVWVSKGLSIAHKLKRWHESASCDCSQNMAPLGKKIQNKNRKCNWHRTVLCMKDIYQQKVSHIGLIADSESHMTWYSI